MKIAVIGGGVSGLTCTYQLSKQHEVTLYEANAYVGGHTDTHALNIDGHCHSVDTGFIVFNQNNYPLFTQMLKELGVSWQNSDMSFSVTNRQINLTYGAEGLSRLFAQKSNIINPQFYRMLWDIKRFYQEAPALINTTDNDLSLGDYLQRNRYSKAFIEGHILPMAAALWSGTTEQVSRFPARYFVAFMSNHRMLQLNDRPQWLTVKGGSNQYVQKLLAHFENSTNNRVKVLTESPVDKVVRTQDNVIIHAAGEDSRYDLVCFACHSNQALAMLDAPSQSEKEVLCNIGYEKNVVTLHSDTSQMPEQREAWASWNTIIPESGMRKCRVSYWMNLLQSLDTEVPIIVTLNGEEEIDPAKIYTTRVYEHPQYTANTLKAQARRSEINGQQRSWFAGAYWGWGFHEDGVKSAIDVVNGISEQE